ncbi:MAG TPA: aminoacyl-tRNA hydrolase [Candidatus Binataceae bacterium]
MAGLKRLFDRFRALKGPDKEKKHPPEIAADIQWVIVGLGNPDTKYRLTRHNAGFMTLDRIAAAQGVEIGARRFKGLTGRAQIDGATVLLVKPQTYYNLSGECVAAVLGYFRVPVERLIVVHDELDLEAGRLRLKRDGGDAGNRGVRSVAESLGSREFIRIRIGIGRPPGDDEEHEFLLRPAAARENEAFAKCVERAAEAVEAVVADGLEKAMNRFNQRL